MVTAIEKGWGTELTYVNNESYCGKVLHFTKNGRTSMHFHFHKIETLYVYKGEFIIRTIDTSNGSKRETYLTFGQSIDIPRVCIHQIEAMMDGDILETSTHENENDKYRVEGGSTQERNICPVPIKNQEFTILQNDS